MKQQQQQQQPLQQTPRQKEYLRQLGQTLKMQQLFRNRAIQRLQPQILGQSVHPSMPGLKAIAQHRQLPLSELRTLPKLSGQWIDKQTANEYDYLAYSRSIQPNRVFLQHKPIYGNA